MRLNITKHFLNDLIEYLFALVVLLNCNTIWTSYEDTQFNKILKIAVIIISILYLAINRKIKYSAARSMTYALTLALFYCLIYVSVVNYNVLSFSCFVIDVIAIYAFVTVAVDKGSGREILLKYRNLILIIAVVSLMFWLMGSVLGVIHSTGTVYSTWTGNDSVKTVTSYYEIYFETQHYGSLVRNTAIFTEAPMFNYNLCIAILIELFYSDKLSKIKCCILIAAVLSTISTTGYCMLIIVLVAKYIFSKNVTKILQVIKIIILPILMIVCLIWLQVLILNKLDSASGSVRVDDFIAGFEAWKTNLFFGAGYNNYNYIKSFMSSYRSSNQGFSNSPMQILYQGGVFLALPYLYFGCKWVGSCIRKKDMQKFLVFACFIFLFTFTISSYKFLSVLMFFAVAIDRTQYNVSALPMTVEESSQ